MDWGPSRRLQRVQSRQEDSLPLHLFIRLQLTENSNYSQRTGNPSLDGSPLVAPRRPEGKGSFRFDRGHRVIPASCQTHEEWKPSTSSASTGLHESLHGEGILDAIPVAGMQDMPLGEFCTGLARSTEAEDAVVTSIVRYSDVGSMRHRFLLLSGSRGGQEFWLRLDRNSRTQHIFSLFSSTPFHAVKDMVRFPTT